jgi:hypothetical protein
MADYRELCDRLRDGPLGTSSMEEAADAIEALVAENAALREWKAKVLAQPTAEEWSCGTQLINRPAP